MKYMSIWEMISVYVIICIVLDSNESVNIGVNRTQFISENR